MPQRRLSLNRSASHCLLQSTAGWASARLRFRIDNQGAASLLSACVRLQERPSAARRRRFAPANLTVRIFNPDLREPSSLLFEIAGAKLSLEHTAAPALDGACFVQFAHHDLGLHRHPQQLLRENGRLSDDALRFCSETDHFPPESQFRYTIEQGWSLLYWLRHRTEEAHGEMMRRIREGRIEVNAFFGNQITELQGPEEMVRMLYPVFALKREYGIPVECGSITTSPASVGASQAPLLAQAFATSPCPAGLLPLGSPVPHILGRASCCSATAACVLVGGADGERVLFGITGQGAGGRSTCAC